jgi:citronellol/citronellal dehydrogenase
MEIRWFQNHVAYSMAKYGMSMCVLGMSSEFKRDGIAFNATVAAYLLSPLQLWQITWVGT